MKRYLLMSLLLTACGSSQAPQSSSSQVVHSNGTVTFTLTARTGPSGAHPSCLNLTANADLYMPKLIVSLSNASYQGRADLQIGPSFCGYNGDGHGVYVRQDGSCNTFTPDAGIPVSAGDSMCLTLEGCPNLPVSVEATIVGDSL